MNRIFLILIAIPILCAFTYPEHMAAKQDFVNMLSMPQYKQRALAELQSIYDTDDVSATRVISGDAKTGDLVTEEIKNPKPLWMRKGFSSKDEVLQLINQHR